MRLAVHIQTMKELRAQGPGDEPDPVTVAAMLDIAGADGIVYRLQDPSDERERNDLHLLKTMVRSHLNLEIEPNDDQLRLALETKPDQVTIVPPSKISYDFGLNVDEEAEELERMAGTLQAGGINVSVLISPDITQVKEARRIRVDYVTINTVPYTSSKTAEEALMNLEEIQTVALGAERLGLRVLVARGLSYRNIGPLAGLPSVEEAILGRSLFNRAVFIGLERAMNEVRGAVHGREPQP